MSGTAAVDQDQVLLDLSAMLRTILDEYGIDDSATTLESRFHDDLELESIDLVTLAGALAEHYGDGVNFAEFIAGLELEAIIELTVGDLVGYVVTELSRQEN
jgi:acyl carrier protein